MRGFSGASRLNMAKEVALMLMTQKAQNGSLKFIHQR
nr:MAG TPA: hypothetical protein [Caudoviricetes sp.]